MQAEARKKYEEPPKFLPSAHIRHKKVSKETLQEMPAHDQKRLQPNLPDRAPLTIEALENHDRKYTTGPCQLRQFGCPACQLSWWRNVLKSKPVSRCRGGKCGKRRYQALPREKEFGIGRCLCPNEACGREFYAYCEASEILNCRKCRSECKPLVHPKWRKRARQRLNPHAKAFTPGRRSRSTSREDLGPHFYPASQSSNEGIPHAPPHWVDTMVDGFSAMGINDRSPRNEHPRGRAQPSTPPARRPRRRRKIFNASDEHVPTGGTVSTFLTQMDFEMSGMEVDLDYDSDDDDEKVGVCKLECDCGNEYTVVMRMLDRAKCYRCDRVNNPLRWDPPRDIQGNSDAEHSCSRCNGQRECPNLAQTNLYRE